MMSGDTDMARAGGECEAEEKWKVWRKRIKGVINGFDMDSGLDILRSMKWMGEAHAAR